MHLCTTVLNVLLYSSTRISYNISTFTLQVNSVDLTEVLQESPFVGKVRRAPIGRSKSGSRSGSTDSNEENIYINMDGDGKENGGDPFRVPQTPRTPRGKRPPTYGRSSPPPSSGKKKTRPVSTPQPMVDLLATSVEKTSELCF